MIPTQSPRKQLYATALIITATFTIGALLFYHNKPCTDYPVHTISSYQESLPDVNENTLVLFDVDDTLITSPALNPNYFTWWFKLLFVLRYPTYIFTNWENAYSLLWTTVPFTLTESSVIKVIKNFQEKHATVLALTSMESGSYGVIESMPAWRYTMLQHMGIEFSQQFADHMFENFPAYRSNYPTLYKGMLCANQQNKGEVLQAFLTYAKFKPSHIIAFDDSLNALQSIGKTCEAASISCTLIQYTHPKTPDTWNTWQALKQFEYFIKDHRWMNDVISDEKGTSVKRMTLHSISSDRIKKFQTASDRLNDLSDDDLLKLLAQGVKIDSSWANAQQIDIDGTTVFVKQVALTDLEKLPENMRSTRNMFDLPLYYQYGVGSAGFGVWRELAAHIMTTQWVLSDECPNFPLLYHWRILPAPKHETMDTESLKSLEENVKYWNGSLAVRRRLEALHDASSRIALFLEYVPYQLESWLRSEFAKGDSAAESASRMVLTNLEEVCDFMQSKDFVHFDAHFENILTDGQRLYFADLGLALSSEFELSNAERDFLKVHHNYDTYYTITHFINAMIVNLFEKGNQQSVLHEYACGQGNRTLSPFLQKTLMRYAPLALEMIEFQHKLRTVSKTTPYPVNKLDAIYKSTLN